jgi:hypothetical protein
MTGSDLQVAKEHVEGVMRGLEKYPDVPLERVQHGGMPRLYESLEVVAMTDEAGTTISFSTKMQSKGPDAYRDELAVAKVNGDTATGTPMGVALHEFGHVVTVRANADKAVAQTAQRLAKGDTQSYVADQVSNYATESDHELAAEAFADVMVNGSSASSLSTAIVGTIDGLYAGRS